MRKIKIGHRAKFRARNIYFLQDLTSGVVILSHSADACVCARVQLKTLFTITAEIHARSLVNFYGQYADRHMNLKFIRRVSERERAIRQLVIVKNKLMSVFNAPVLRIHSAIAS